MAPNLPSSSDSPDKNAKSTSKPLRPAALAMAAILAANALPAPVQAREDYTNWIKKITGDTRQKAGDLCCEIDNQNWEANGIFIITKQPKSLVGLNDTPKNTPKDINSGITVNPSQNGLGANVFLQEDDYRVEGALLSTINGIKDARLKASLAMLYSGAQLGTHIEVEAGSEIHRLAVAQSAIAFGGKVKLSIGFLNKLMETSFLETSEKFKPEMQQKSIGLEYGQDFNDSLLKELKTGIVYYDVKDVRLGKISDLIVNDANTYSWAEIYGGVRWGSKLLADVTTTFSLSDEIKLDVSAGGEQTRYNAMYDTPEKIQTGGVAGINLTIQPNNQNKLSFWGDTSKINQKIKANYSHKISETGGLETFIEGTHTKNTGGLSDENKVMVGIRGTFGGPKGAKFSPLWKPFNKTEVLTYNDLQPNQHVATPDIEVHEAVTFKDTIVNIDKTTFVTWDGIDLNPDDTISSLHLDNGGFTVSSVARVNDTNYSAFFSVVGGKLALVNFKGLNNQMIADGMKKGDIKNLRISVNDTSGLSIYSINIVKWSVKITTQIERAFTVTAAQEAEFFAGTKTITQVNTENTLDTTPPVTSAAPSISTAATDTTVSVSQKINENGTGYYLILPATSAAPTVAAVLAGTAFTMTANTAAVVNITGLTANTAYKYYFVAKDSATTPNAQTTVSTGLSITTLNADALSSTGAPTTSSITSTGATVTNHIADTNGIQNVNYFLYSDAAGTVQVATNTTGIFTGLSVYTTYYAKTTADTKNGTTGVYSTQASSLTSFTTLDPNPASSPVISGVTSNSVYTAPVNPNYTVPAGHTATATLNGNPFTNGASVWNGTYTLVVTFTKTSNGLQSTTTVPFSVDSVPPSAPAITGVTNGSANNVTKVPDWTDASGTTSTATLNGAAFTKGTAVSANGSYTLVVTSTKTSNGLTANTTTTWSIDKTLPTVDTLTLTGSSGAVSGYTKTTAITLSTSGSDNTGVTGWLVNESASTPLASAVTASSQPTSYNLSTGDGTKTVYVWVRDAAGNVSLSRSATIILDTAGLSWTPTSSFPTLNQQWASFSGTITFNKGVQSVTAVRLIDSNGVVVATLTWTANNSTSINVSGTAPTGVGQVYVEAVVVGLSWLTGTFDQNGTLAGWPYTLAP